MAILLIEKNVYVIPCEILRYLYLSILLIPIINFSVFIKQEKGTFLMCVVFLCITVTHGSDESPLLFGFNRIVDTTVGIIIALIVNRIPQQKQAHRQVCRYRDNQPKRSKGQGPLLNLVLLP